MPRRPDLSRPENLLPLRPLDFSVLLVLSREEQYGYGIAKAVAEEGVGSIELAPGNLYQVLDRLLDWGLIKEAERRPVGESGDRRRRHYGITLFGRQVVALEAARLHAMMATVEAVAEG